MCGISGIFDAESPPSRNTLATMNGCVEHRGPDDAGIYSDRNIGLAHRRLSIIDVKSGDQPMYNEDESVVLIFNGEIYNYQDLREDLCSKNHRFSTDSDTEVIVHLYEEYGTDCPKYLDGMFAFALWDRKEERLLLARDHMGIKPLIVGRDGDRVVFGSEVTSVLHSGIDNGGIDQTALEQYFAFGYFPAPNTIFRNIWKLLPGESMTISADGVERKRFYRPRVDRYNEDISTAADTLRERVDDAVRERMQSDVPLGAFLSGGIDSSIVVGTMAELSDESIKTFTVGFDEDLFDETWAASAVADYHDTDHHEYIVSPGTVRETIPTVLDRLGEPFADQSLIPSYIVAQKTRENVKVALSGDGADELFAGYDRYRAEYLSGYYRRIPKIIREGAIEPIVNSLPASRSSRLGEAVFKSGVFARGGGVDDAAKRQFEWLRLGDEQTRSAVPDLDPDGAGAASIRDFRSQSKDESITQPGEFDVLQATDVNHFLPNRILHKSDLASMFNSLEVRVPFMDTEVVKLALAMPTKYKITRRDRKRVLKRAFEDRLPDEILTRDKQGFDMPIGEWFKGPLADDFRATMQSPGIGIIDEEAAFDIYDQHVSNRRENGDFLWSLYVFKKWARRMREQGFL